MTAMVGDCEIQAVASRNTRGSCPSFLGDLSDSIGPSSAPPSLTSKERIVVSQETFLGCLKACAMAGEQEEDGFLIKISADE